MFAFSSGYRRSWPFVLRGAVAAALLAGLVASPADAQERECHGQLGPPVPPRGAERVRLDGFVAHRRIFGFRTDLGYVRSLVRSDGLWDDFLDIPITRSEQRYIRLRDRVDLGPDAERYLRERPDIYGGRSIEDGWPGDPYMLVRVTRDVAVHRAALLRLARYPTRLRVRWTALSERQLGRLQRRILRDDKRLAAMGFDLASVGRGRGRIHVGVITARSDYARHFARRYGPSVQVQRIATRSHVVHCSKADAFSLHADGQAMTVHWTSGGSAKLERLEVTEHPDRIEVGVVEQSYTGANTADLRFESTAASLVAPLGDRAVVDAGTGLRLRLRGPLPGAPACPAERSVDEVDAEVQYEDEDEDEDDRQYPLRRVDRYLLAHADEYGGFRVEGRFALYGFTRNRERHERALKRMVRDPTHLRTFDATFTADQLSDQATRIQYDAQLGGGFLDGYGAFLVQRAEADASGVIVTLVTQRPDHAAYFAARYGAHVRTQVIGDRHECATPDGDMSE